MKKRILLALALLLAVLALPFLLRTSEHPLAELLSGHDTLIIISAHSEPMKFELERAFRDRKSVV